MPSVILLDNEGNQVEVTAPWHLVSLVYGRGYRPLSGTVAAALDILAGGTPLDETEGLPVLLGDLSNPVSDAFLAIQAIGGVHTHTEYVSDDELATALEDYALMADVTAGLSTKADLASPTFTGTVGGITKSMVGLGNVDNTADSAKPVSTAQQSAIDTASTADRNRANHTGTQPSATLSDLTEVVQDIVGALIVAGTNTTVTYDDAAGTFTINASSGGSTDAEVVRDTIGGALVAGAGIQITVNDAGDTITIASTAVLPTRQVISGTGLSGGGDLSADRTLSVLYGTTGTTAAVGNDSRFTTAATTAVVGHVELADNTETQTGTDTVRAVTPAGLASVTATETRAGLAEIATAGEASTGTDDARMMTPAKTKTLLDLKANLASPTFTGTVAGITKSMVGLGNVDNTADTAKPVSTAQQTALDLKADKAVTTTTQAGTTYTLALTDAGIDIEFTSATAVAVSVPTNATAAFPIGTIITLWQRGAGQITVAATTPGTTTLESRGSAFKSAGQNGPMQLKKRATDGWLLTGDITT